MGKLYTLVLLFFLFGVSAFAQKMSIEGTVKSSKGESLPGSTVLIKGSASGVSTDLNGKFVIQALPEDILVISFIGFESREIPVGNQTRIDIVLLESALHLKEVVVTALGIEKQKSNLGYSISDVKGDDLTMARDQNPITGLTGKVAGLSVGQSSEMLRKPTVLLRGNEVNLYVVDGVPISTDTWNISPDDIQSYTVLKGPTASALYGSRGQYGAILITTKKACRNQRLRQA